MQFKIRDSLLIFNDITGKNIAYTREKVELVVVYNCEKNPLPNQLKKGKTQESPSRTAISDYFTAKGQKELILFDLERYENLYFGRVHTYSPERFEAYLNGELNRELHYVPYFIFYISVVDFSVFKFYKNYRLPYLNNIEAIYSKLARPLQELENERGRL